MKIDGRKLSHAQLEAIRFQAVKAVQAGQPPTAVARALGLYPARVFVWLAAYRAGGWDALRARKASGRPKRLTGSQLRWIYNTVTSKNPLQLQFPFALWTRAMIGTLIRRQYGIKLSAISVGRLLAQMGLSCQKPLSRAFEQDATLVKQWIERDFPKIRALAKKERAVVFFADESGVRSDFHAGTTWGIRGKTPCCPPHWQTLSSQYAVCDLGQRRTAVHDLAEAALSGAVHRVPAPVDHKLSEKDLSRRRRIARTQGQVGASLRAPGERPPPTVLSPAVLAGNQSGRTGLERRQEPRRCSNIDPRPQRFASRSEFKVATPAKKSRQSSRVLPDGNDALCSRLVPNI